MAIKKPQGFCSACTSGPCVDKQFCLYILAVRIGGDSIPCKALIIVIEEVKLAAS